MDEIVRMQRAERDAFGEALMKALMDNIPWGLKVDLGNGQVAELTPMNGDQDASRPNRRPIYPDGTPLATDPENPVQPVGYEPWSITFDWRLTNCDQDHIEVTAKISGGGGIA